MSTTRRSFLTAAASTAAGALAASSAFAADEKPKKKSAKNAKNAKGQKTAPVPIANEICCFIKPLQKMSHDELADAMADIGFNGVEVTVRAKGYIEPDKAAEELPRLADALKKRKLNITIMTTDINEASAENEKLLRLAAGLGVKHYRLGPIYYDLDKPIWAQVEALAPRFKALAELNKSVGIQGLYQNHSGVKYVGAAIWDLQAALAGIDPHHLGVAFDILHATVEGATSWPLEFSLIRPHMGAAFFKDFDYTEIGARRKIDVVPLGSGRVEPRYGQMLMKSGFTGPISLHKEYAMSDPAAKQIADLRKDLATLKKWITA